MTTLAGVSWNLVIVGEAHKIAAYSYGEKIKRLSGTGLANSFSVPGSLQGRYQGSTLKRKARKVPRQVGTEVLEKEVW